MSTGVIASQSLLFQEPPAYELDIGDDFTDVALLLGFDDGVDGATATNDESMYAQGPIVFSESAEIDTAQFKFGVGALLRGPITLPHSDLYNFNTGEFCVEFFWRPTAADLIDNFNGARFLITKGRPATTTDYDWSWRLLYNYSTGPNRQILTFGYQEEGSPGSFFSLQATATSPTVFFTGDTQHHIAVCRNLAGVGRMFIDGALVASDATMNEDFLISSGAADLVIGGFTHSSTYTSIPHAGHIDELRIRHAVQYDNSGFTPPSSPFPRM